MESKKRGFVFGSASAASSRIPAAKKTASTAPPARTTRSTSGRSTGTYSQVSGASRISRAPSAQAAVKSSDEKPEPVQTYLRMRPVTHNSTAQSCVQVMSAKEVLLVPNNGMNLFLSSPRLSKALGDPKIQDTDKKLAALYTFDDVFENTTQEAFFEATALPLVRSFLKAENCLLFAHGPTGSGKTYTVQGAPGELGLLPRVIDVVCNSVRPMGELRPSKTGQFCTYRELIGSPARQAVAASTATIPDAGEGCLWISYCEIYNEKVYDLLEPPNVVPLRTVSGSSSKSGNSANSTASGHVTNALSKMRSGLKLVKRSALNTTRDKTPNAVCVSNANEARDLLERGLQNRRVFSTLANRASSRSHAIFTFTLVRRNGRVSRFSVVDLAGSERATHTQATGARLKEAGSINTSLMVLAHCLEVLRSNSVAKNDAVSRNGTGTSGARSLAVSSMGAKSVGGTNTGGHPAKTSLVPYRHSKLTETLQTFFTGPSRVSMIVNVDPYTTRAEELGHVFKFASVARGVLTTPSRELEPLEIIEEAMPQRVVKQVIFEAGSAPQDVVYEEDDTSDNEGEKDAFIDSLLNTCGLLREAVLSAQLMLSETEASHQHEFETQFSAKQRELEKKYEELMCEKIDELEAAFARKLALLGTSVGASKGDMSLSSIDGFLEDTSAVFEGNSHSATDNIAEHDEVSAADISTNSTINSAQTSREGTFYDAENGGRSASPTMKLSDTLGKLEHALRSASGGSIPAHTTDAVIDIDDPDDGTETDRELSRVLTSAHSSERVQLSEETSSSTHNNVSVLQDCSNLPADDKIQAKVCSREINSQRGSSAFIQAQTQRPRISAGLPRLSAAEYLAVAMSTPVTEKTNGITSEVAEVLDADSTVEDAVFSEQTTSSSLLSKTATAPVIANMQPAQVQYADSTTPLHMTQIPTSTPIARDSIALSEYNGDPLDVSYASAMSLGSELDSSKQSQSFLSEDDSYPGIRMVVRDSVSSVAPSVVDGHAQGGRLSVAAPSDHGSRRASSGSYNSSKSTLYSRLSAGSAFTASSSVVSDDFRRTTRLSMAGIPETPNYKEESTISKIFNTVDDDSDDEEFVSKDLDSDSDYHEKVPVKVKKTPKRKSTKPKESDISAAIMNLASQQNFDLSSEDVPLQVHVPRSARKSKRKLGGVSIKNVEQIENDVINSSSS